MCISNEKKNTQIKKNAEFLFNDYQNIRPSYYNRNLFRFSHFKMLRNWMQQAISYWLVYIPKAFQTCLLRNYAIYQSKFRIDNIIMYKCSKILWNIFTAEVIVFLAVCDTLTPSMCWKHPDAWIDMSFFGALACFGCAWPFGQNRNYYFSSFWQKGKTNLC